MTYGQRFMTLYRRQGSRPFPTKRNAEKQNGCLISIVVAHRLGCSGVCGIFLEGWNSCPWPWQVHSYPLHHQGSPKNVYRSPTTCARGVPRWTRRLRSLPLSCDKVINYEACKNIRWWQVLWGKTKWGQEERDGVLIASASLVPP